MRRPDRPLCALFPEEPAPLLVLCPEPAQGGDLRVYLGAGRTAVVHLERRLVLVLLICQRARRAAPVSVGYEGWWPRKAVLHDYVAIHDRIGRDTLRKYVAQINGALGAALEPHGVAPPVDLIERAKGLRLCVDLRFDDRLRAVDLDDDAAVARVLELGPFVRG